MTPSQMQMQAQEILVQQRGTICTLTLNRPEKRNALSPSLLLRLADTLRALPEETRVVVIQGAGDKAFSAGYDLGQAPAGPGPAAGAPLPDAQKVLAQALETVASCRCPIVAMIRGYCMGAGLELALTCDIRVAADDARFAMPPARLGTVYPPAGLWKFVHLIGPAATKELFFTGSPIRHARALELGLVNQVVPVAALAQVVEALAQDMASSAPLSVAALKRMINRLAAMPALSPDEQRRFEDLMSSVRSSDDFKEGRRAFAEKRKPEYRGR